MKVKQTGFTLVEVLIVLAIAGIILALVVVALGQSQVSKRDTVRKADAGRLILAVKQFSANNNGNLPKSNADLFSVEFNYIASAGSSFKDPSGANYNINYSQSPPTSIANISASDQMNCAGGTYNHVQDSRSFAVAIYLENGSVYCVEY